MINIKDLPPAAQKQAKKSARESKTPKYHNIRTTVDGITFDSKKEAARYGELKLLFRAGKIKDLQLQPQYTLSEAYTTADGTRVQAIRYQADFAYKRVTEPDCTGNIYWILIVEDVKSKATKTRVYGIKKKLMREKFGIEISEV